MTKENLIILPSFPTNSVILKGLRDYLDQYFNVYFIDLPGFIETIPPLTSISINGYRDYVEKQIASFNLSSYIIAGISFGFMLVSNIHPDTRCKGIIAMEPFLGANSLKKRRGKLIFATALIKLILFFNLFNSIWNHSLFKRFINLFKFLPKSVVEATLAHVDSKTFFSIAYILANYRKISSFHNLPHVLIINRKDKTVDSSYIESAFVNNLKQVLVIETDIEHYPNDLTKEYFRKRVTQKNIQDTLGFLLQRK